MLEKKTIRHQILAARRALTPAEAAETVSYTHLTLPTNNSV